ncbi:histidine phosphatase family protein [Paenibacillus albidus]|nr:histidine phosphatase family protein [Paenibacillus albidus]
MRIGLIRHFKVVHPSTGKWMTPQQFNQWVEGYNVGALAPPQELPPLHAEWSYCLSSDLQRACETAKAVWPQEFQSTDQLREIEIAAVFHWPIKLPLYVWLILGRIAWYISHRSQAETRQETAHRAKRLVDQIESGPRADVLLVTHGAFMKVLRKELHRRGYAGDYFFTPANGRLYTFENKS